MTSDFPVPQPVTPAWLDGVLRANNLLHAGTVAAVDAEATSAFNSHTQHLRVAYTADAAPASPAALILKRNIDANWGREAGAEEVRFYHLAGTLRPAPPALVPCYAAALNEASGDSYLLLRDVSASHAPPINRDQQISIVHAVPAEDAIMRVTDALAQHHAFWWNHPLLHASGFAVGFWSRNAERFRLYHERRLAGWHGLLADDADWFPADLRELYTEVFERLPRYWARWLEPRFRANTHLSLVHGDAYFSNFLCPKDGADGPTFLIDWQSPAVDISAYDLANLCATSWTRAQRQDGQREQRILQRYHATLLANGVQGYAWDDLLADYRSGLIFWLLMPLQDRRDGAPKTYWWPKMQCLAAAFQDWNCLELLREA